MQMAETALTRGALARETGVHLETIRFCENRGLLPEVARDASGYRRYPIDSIRRVRFIKRAQELGFTLAEIQELLELRARPGLSSARVKRLAQEKLSEVDSRLRDLTRIREALQSLTEACDGHGPVACCPIIMAIEEDK